MTSEITGWCPTIKSVPGRPTRKHHLVHGATLWYIGTQIRIPRVGGFESLRWLLNTSKVSDKRLCRVSDTLLRRQPRVTLWSIGGQLRFSVNGASLHTTRVIPGRPGMSLLNHRIQSVSLTTVCLSQARCEGSRRSVPPAAPGLQTGPCRMRVPQIRGAS